MALAAALLGAWVGARLNADDMAYVPALRPIAVTAAVAIFALLAFPLFTDSSSNARGAVVLSDVTGAPQRTVNATVTLSPRDAADDANWLTATAWQGGGQLVVDRLTRVSQGVYKTNRAIPVYGKWKTMIRLHTGNSIMALPVYAPADAAIPLRQVPAVARFDRRFYSDKELLQREAKTQAAWVWNVGYATVLSIALALIALLAWGIHRFSSTTGRSREGMPDWAPEPEPEPQPAPYPMDLPEWAQRARDPVAPAGEARRPETVR
jgi:hypothetical protein